MSTSVGSGQGEEVERLQQRVEVLEHERKHLLAVIEILQEIAGRTANDAEAAELSALAAEQGRIAALVAKMAARAAAERERESGREGEGENESESNGDGR